MSNIDVISMCIRNLWKRKLRTFLTVLGVVIGSASIVLMISLGLATDAHFAEIIATMEDEMTTISISSRRWSMIQDEDGNWVQPDFVPDLDDEAFAAMNNIPGVLVASPIMWGQIFLRSGPYTMSAWNVQGMKPEALQFMGFDLVDGRFLQEGDMNAAVFGSEVEISFMAPGEDWMNNREQRRWMGEEVEQYVDVLNDPIQMSADSRFIWGGMQEAEIDGFRPIRSTPLEVVGIFSSRDPWRNQTIFINIEVLHDLNFQRAEANREMDQDWGFFSAVRRGEREPYDQGIVRVATPDDAARVAEAIRDMGFNAWYMGDFIDAQREQQQALQNLLAGIATISLLVAAISIANTMIMSVYERTREIGIMKVIGASISDVKRLFLLEAMLIGFLGGIFGILLSFLGSYILNNFDVNLGGVGMQGVPGADVSLITTWLVGVALLVSSAVGLISGYIPARRATKLSALAAIRTE